MILKIIILNLIIILLLNMLIQILQKKNIGKKEEEYSFYNSFTGFFGNMKDKFNEVIGNLDNKFNELNVKDNIYENSSKAYKILLKMLQGILRRN